MKRFLVVLAALAFVGCPKDPEPTTPDDKAEANSPCPAYCAHLKDLGCSEGKDADCESVCRELRRSVQPFDPACALGAKTAKAAQPCGVCR